MRANQAQIIMVKKKQIGNCPNLVAEFLALQELMVVAIHKKLHRSSSKEIPNWLSIPLMENQYS